MTYPMFPKPSDIIADSPSRGSALVAYARNARATLRDGRIVRPKLRLVANVVDLYRDAGLDFPIAVSPDSCIIVKDAVNV